MTEGAVTFTRRLVGERRERILDEAVRRVARDHADVGPRGGIRSVEWHLKSLAYDPRDPVGRWVLDAIRAEYRRLVAG